MQGEPGQSVQKVVAGWDLLQQMLAENGLEGALEEAGRPPQLSRW